MGVREPLVMATWRTTRAIPMCWIGYVILVGAMISWIRTFLVEKITKSTNGLADNRVSGFTGQVLVHLPKDQEQD